MGCHGIRRDDGLGFEMKSNDLHEFASELKVHLETLEILKDLEPKIESDLALLVNIDEEISSHSKRCDELQIQIIQSNKEYQTHNAKYLLGNSKPDFETTKQLRKEAWAKIYESGEERDRIYLKLKSLRHKRDELSKEVKNLSEKIKSTRDFFSYHNSHVGLFSIVTVELQGDKSIFLLLTEKQRQKAWLNDLSTFAIESPIGKACMNKIVGDVISYKVPNGLEVKGKILGCSLPTFQMMEQLIETFRANRIGEKGSKTNPFLLHDLHGSNNSRNRKGG